MDDSVQSVLLTLAELSIAYVGFAAIVGALSTTSEEWTVGTRILFRSMIDTGLMNVFLCLIPNVFYLLYFEGTSLWIVSSSLALLIVVLVFTGRMIQIRRTVGTPLAIGKWVLIPLMILAIAMYFTNAVVWRLPGVYVLATGVHLLVNTVQFLAVMWTLFPIRAGWGDA